MPFCVHYIPDYDNETPQSNLALELHDAVLEHLTHVTGKQGPENQQKLEAPIFRLPVELLVEIFTLSSYDIGLSVTPHGVIAPALTLAHICNFWRTIAVSTPHLWSRITVDLAYDAHRFIHMMEFYIRQSSSAPLILQIQALKYATTSDRVEYVEEVDQYGWDIFQMLFNERNRWFQVSIKLRWPLFTQASHRISTLPSNGRDDFTHLEVLEMGWESLYWPRRATNWMFNLFQSAPVLHSLSLPYYDSSFPFPVHQLTTVSLYDDDLSWISTPSMLKLCSNIETFFLVCGPERIWTTPNVVINCSTLKSLSLLMKDFVPVCETLSTLTLPSLATVHITTPDPGLHCFPLARSTASDWKRKLWFQNFTEMLHRSSCSLRSLTLDGNLFLEDQLSQIFALTPELTYLCIRTLSWYEPVLIDHLFQELVLERVNEFNKSGDRSGSNLLPKLISMAIYFSDLDNISPYRLATPSNILSMIESRRNISFPHSDIPVFSELEFFEFSADFNTDQGCKWATMFRSDIEPRLRELENQGMFKVNVKMNVFP